MLAFVREPAPCFRNALSAHPGKHTIDFALALEQHRLYAAALRAAGLTVAALPPLPGFPDAPFVEDAAVILAGRAYICALREETRRGETPSAAAAIAPYLPTVTLAPPLFIDGGDALAIGASIYIGMSRRTSRAAAEFLQTQTDLEVIPVAVTAGLHLKSAVSYIGRDTVVINPAHIDAAPFKRFSWIEATGAEGYAANCLAINDTVLLPAGYPATMRRIAERGFNAAATPMSEFAKADGGVTCLSLLLPGGTKI